MNAHALSVLEYFPVLELVAGHASSEQGAERVRNTRPSTDKGWIEQEQTTVAAMRSMLAGEAGWKIPQIPDVKEALNRLRVEGAALSAGQLLQVAILLGSGRHGIQSLKDSRQPPAALAVLQSYAERLFADPKLESALNRAIDENGEVKDDASPQLRRIRRELRGAEGHLVSLLEKIMSRLEPHQQVTDMSVTVRNGRYVIPLRREGRGAVGGIVHDSSATGGTIFVEPPAAIEAGNRIRELEAEEVREIDRILSELSESLNPFYEQLMDSFESLVALDSIYARARFAIKFDCNPVRLGDPANGFRIVDGRHPLLVAQGVDVVPFSLEMLPAERTLLVSGPNTGGKTVLLKALALISLLTQSGIPVPVGEDTTVSVFDDVYADIGDEQSIEASLSTFSAHIRNLRDVLNNATSRTLVLIDELGSGTDPVEGAALGGAILESLARRNSLTIATTHLGSLKELAIENSSIINASLQFDPVALAPSYRLIKGIPGRSYGISIARRLEMPESILKRAEERLPTGERDANALLADLEAREERMIELEREAAAIHEDAARRARKVADRERNAGIKERQLEREERKATRSYLLEARKEIERIIKQLQEAAAAHDSGGKQSEQIKAARKLVENLVVEQNVSLEKLERSEKGARPGNKKRNNYKAVSAGDRVEVESLGGKKGQVLEVRGREAIVAVGALKLTVPLKNLVKTDFVPPPIEVQIVGDIPDERADSEIDLRGMRVGDIEDTIVHALDNAIRADLKTIRIIHGKGTGALRERVNEMLKLERRVVNYRLGAWNEGGAGVTVVELS